MGDVFANRPNGEPNPVGYLRHGGNKTVPISVIISKGYYDLDVF